MADPRFRGSGVALVTPFRDGEVDEKTLRELVRFHHREGTAALIVCGSTGEAAAMTPIEQRRAIEAVVQENGGRLPVIAGCGGMDTRAVSALAAQARKAGADAVLVSPPPYSKPTQRGLLGHFRAVTDAGDLPVILYNIPGRATVNLLPSTVAELAEDERVIGVKEAAVDLSQISDLARLTRDRLALWSGNDDHTLPILALGGAGVISVLANVAPAGVARLVERFAAGDLDEARSLHFRYLPLMTTLFLEPNPVPVKAALAWMGFDVGPTRQPLAPLEPSTRKALVKAMKSAGLRPAGAAA